MSFFLWSILCTMSIDPWFYLLASIPPALVGGFGSIILGTMCFITDTNKNTEQSWHFTWLQATITGGLVVGSFSGPLVFKYFGYAAVFGTACACSSIATLFVLFFVPESVVRIDGEVSDARLATPSSNKSNNIFIFNKFTERLLQLVRCIFSKRHVSYLYKKARRFQSYYCLVLHNLHLNKPSDYGRRQRHWIFVRQCKIRMGHQ